MPGIFKPWPYATKAIVEHNRVDDILSVWLTFRHSMDQANKPALAKWVVKVNDVAKTSSASAWQDEWTLLLTVDNIVGAIVTVTVEYLGPTINLATTWRKQWEPFGPILSVEIPVLPGTKILSTGPADQDDVDVTNIIVLFLDCSANNVIIGGLIGGIDGQVLHIARLCPAGNDGTCRHNKNTGNQRLLLHAGGDETLTGEYGGWILACNGTNWYDASHSKHV